MLRSQAAARTYWRDEDATDPEDWVRFKILGFNDFHGQLEPRRLFGRTAGGASALASYLRAESAQSRNGAFIVHAGDQVGASPPVSALLQDEPSITFLNMLANQYCSYAENENEDDNDDEEANYGDLDEERFDPRCNLVGTLGNHEFDEGVDEMLRLVNGGIHPDGPFLDANYRGARFPYVPELKKRGVHAIVVTIHQGTSQNFFSGPTGADALDVGGSIGPIITALDDEIDIVVAGHWHRFTNALMPNKNGKLILVTQAFSRSTAYADIDVAIDPETHDIVEKSAEILTTWGDQGPGLEPDQQVADLVSKASAAVKPLVERVIAQAASDILRAENATGESALGNLIADAQRSAMATDIAFMNPGGIRADVFAGQVIWGDLFTVQPFNNNLVKMDLSGARTLQLLNQQWAGQPFARVLKTSGILYTWQENNPADFRDNTVVAASVMINGQALDTAAIYTVTVNSFLAAGGDNFSVLPTGTNRRIGPVDLDALITYLQALPQPFSAGIEGRIQSTP